MFHIKHGACSSTPPSPTTTTSQFGLLNPNPNPNSVYTHVRVYRIYDSHQQLRDLYVQPISTSTFVDASRRPADPHVRISKPSQTTSGHRPCKPRLARPATSPAPSFSTAQPVRRVGGRTVCQTAAPPPPFLQTTTPPLLHVVVV
jgi:hypothetical protein